MPTKRPHIFLDFQLSPALAPWIAARFSVRCTHALSLGLLHRPDGEIFRVAGVREGVLMSKDDDFARIVRKNGPPPAILWLRCGNRSNAELKKILMVAMPPALQLLASGEPVVEIADLPPRRFIRRGRG